MRVRIAATVGQSCREVERKVLESWLRLSGDEFERFVDDICGWGIDGGNVLVPPNKENEAKGTVVRENVQFDRESSSSLLSCIVAFFFFFLFSFAFSKPFRFIFFPPPPLLLKRVISPADSTSKQYLEFARIIRRAYEEPA